jgi:hypothetical protein
MKTDFAQLIRDETATVRALHARLHETSRLRGGGAGAYADWEDACQQFHTYASTLDPFLERACREKRYTDKDLIEFVICFLEVDPHFFRSGYLKQELLTRIKRSELRKPDWRRLRGVLMDAVNRRGTREFKYYCRLAAVIADATLLGQLDAATTGAPSARSNRARMMLAHIQQKNHSRSVSSRP